jgi:predicted nuclease with TOPRIM domain
MDQISNSLNLIALKLNEIQEDMKDVKTEVKQTNEKVTGLSEKIVQLETKVERAETDRLEMINEFKSVWDNFRILKEELKKDLKEYINIVAKNEIKSEVFRLLKWVIPISIGIISIVIGVIKSNG